MTVRVGAVVEGHGEVRALPILIRRICETHEVFDLHVEHPYRLPRTQMLNEKLGGAVRMQRIRVGDNGVVLVLLDADDDDPGEVRARITSILGRPSTRRASPPLWTLPKPVGAARPSPHSRPIFWPHSHGPVRRDVRPKIGRAHV